jgi:hypothetical protein
MVGGGILLECLEDPRRSESRAHILLRLSPRCRWIRPRAPHVGEGQRGDRESTSSDAVSCFHPSTRCHPASERRPIQDESRPGTVYPPGTVLSSTESSVSESGDNHCQDRSSDDSGRQRWVFETPSGGPRHQCARQPMSWVRASPSRRGRVAREEPRTRVRNHGRISWVTFADRSSRSNQ